MPGVIFRILSELLCVLIPHLHSSIHAVAPVAAAVESACTTAKILQIDLAPLRPSVIELDGRPDLGREEIG
jgi:hypothetical protein